ncbi:CLUMA_CG014423, isoform B [Clunio marinus]|uniref:CLUMA_CG014423, isoform B n=1 Tax=Clunio marinus TaxID=568069 RepID=A0A1J1IN83_9DIPT|nr:CLUMA_CG014423, isoform B [Clunio marinus]
MAVLVANNSKSVNLTRSLEKILDECSASGELKLQNRKLKDFPKCYGKFNLSDTVFADLSRNRFCELPEDVTSFAFLERLLLYHNAIRSIPESIRSLQSLTFLDLRSNQLTTLPREVCLLPLQIFLISNNRLTTLPDELGRMNELTELDAGFNQLTHLPARLSELTNLRSLCLRSNQLVYLPREFSNLRLISLDISCNKIASLPVELRLMTSLVDLELSDNPLTSPPAQICIRGIVHVFKYLETIVGKEGKSEASNSNSLRRTLPKQNSTPAINDAIKVKRHTSDSGYSTSDCGLDSKWANEQMIPKWQLPSTPLHIRTELSKSDTPTPAGVSPGGFCNHSTSLDDDQLKRKLEKRHMTNSNPTLTNGLNGNLENSPEANTPDSQKSDEKIKGLGNVQTYREYKEALRQQRSQESLSIYRAKDVSTPDGSSELHFRSQTSSPYNGSSQNSPISPYRNMNLSMTSINGHGIGNSEEGKGRPVQKVTPSRSSSNNNNSTYQNGSRSSSNGNISDSYEKPNSPQKTSGILQHNNVPNIMNGNNIKGVLVDSSTHKPLSGTTVGYVNNKPGQKLNKSVSWNRDVPTEKLSFTMRREFDKHKEEVELIKQLKSILQTKLKMSLPDDIAPALTDGVVLCHLANHIKPRSVGSIHVPSAAVPKLTMARCRRNVDNFLEACRKIGVDEEIICSCGDIVPTTDDPSNCRPPDEQAMFRTINALLMHQLKLKMQDRGSDVTNTNTASDGYDEDSNLTMSMGGDGGIRRAPNSLDFTRKRKFTSVKFLLPENNENFLNEVIEECEYDSDIGKFNCKEEEDENIQEDSENSETSSMVDHFLNIEHMNDLNSPHKFDEKNVFENLLCCAADVLEGKGIVQVAITVCELIKHQIATPPSMIKSPQRYQNLNYSNMNNNGACVDGIISKSSSSSSSQLSATSPSSPIV